MAIKRGESNNNVTTIEDFKLRKKKKKVCLGCQNTLPSTSSEESRKQNQLKPKMEQTNKREQEHKI